jgi:hypothetical protein
MEQKTCSKCGQSKALSEFSRNRRAKDGLQHLCRPCHSASVVQSNQRNRLAYRERTNRWYAENRERQRVASKDGARRRKYGLTLAEHEEMEAAQGGVCAICQQPETFKSKSGTVHRLAVDHDHKTGRIRGLLCRNCNAALGHLREDLGLFRRAVSYLESYAETSENARYILPTPPTGRPTGLRSGRYTMPERTARNDRHGMAKLTWELAERIRVLHAEGKTQREIAKEIGVSQGTVSNVLLGKSWRT